MWIVQPPRLSPQCPPPNWCLHSLRFALPPEAGRGIGSACVAGPEGMPRHPIGRQFSQHNVPACLLRLAGSSSGLLALAGSPSDLLAYWPARQQAGSPTQACRLSYCPARLLVCSPSRRGNPYPEKRAISRMIRAAPAAVSVARAGTACTLPERDGHGRRASIPCSNRSSRTLSGDSESPRATRPQARCLAGWAGEGGAAGRGDPHALSRCAGRPGRRARSRPNRAFAPARRRACGPLPDVL